MGWPTLTTDRLVLRPLAMDDLDQLAALHAEESFWRYPSGRGWSRSETESFLERTIEHYQDPGVAVSAVVVADTGELAGWAGLSIPTFLPEILPAVEAGWRLGERYRGHGFATEAGRAWVRYGFEDLGLESIVSIYEPENAASGAVMQRLGFTLERQTTHPTHGVPLHVMSLSRDAWRSADRQRSFLEACISPARGTAVGEGAFAPGPALWVGTREVAHFDSERTLDVRLTRSAIRRRREELTGDDRVSLRSGTSDWIEITIESDDDRDWATLLVRDAVAANLPTATPGLPTTGADLQRRRRFH